jgi:hypothetical protein
LINLSSDVDQVEIVEQVEGKLRLSEPQACLNSTTTVAQLRPGMS